MKPTLTLLTVLVALSAAVRAEDPAPKILRERIEWCDMNVEETGRNDQFERETGQPCRVVRAHLG